MNRTMNPTAKTRKPVEDLDTTDLEAFPVWEFLSDDGEDDEDETWVKPVLSRGIPTAALSLCLAGVARLPSGAVYPAVIFGDTLHGFSVNGLALLTTKGRVLIHESDASNERLSALRRLGLTEKEVFPVEFATRAPLASTGGLAFGRFGIAGGG